MYINSITLFDNFLFKKCLPYLKDGTNLIINKYIYLLIISIQFLDKRKMYIFTENHSLYLSTINCLFQY